MENIPSTMVIHKYVGGKDTRFDTISGTFVKNPLGRFIGVIRRGTYQVASEYSR